MIRGFVEMFSLVTELTGPDYLKLSRQGGRFRIERPKQLLNVPKLLNIENSESVLHLPTKMECNTII